MVATEIKSLYSYSASASVRVITVDSELVSQFCHWHGAFQRTLSKCESDLDLEALVRLSGGLRYRILSAPLPLCHPSLIDSTDADLLLKRVRAVGQSYSDLHEASRSYESAFLALRSSTANPLWWALEADLADRQADYVGLLIKPARLVTAVRDLATALPLRLEVTTESWLRSAVALDRLYILGAGRWYSGFVFSAPRASDLRVVRYGVLNDSPPDEATFVKPLKQPMRAPFATVRGRGVGSTTYVGADEVRPMLDIASIMRRAGEGHGAGVSGASAELVRVRALLLEQDLAVLVSTADGASELTVDLREDAEKLVHRVPTANLEPGMAILVRREGGGDYIIAAADEIMANEAGEFRRCQRHWKLLLRNLVKKLGIAEVVDQLQVAGSRIANYQNVRNWTNPRSIRTYNKEDFEAIFKVIGLAVDADRYWSMMEVIDRTHRRAGRLIRHRLLEQVQCADLSPLQAEGRQDFELPGEVGGGSLTAIRIVAMPSEVEEVYPSAIHRLVDLAD